MRIVAVADTHTFEAHLGIVPEGDVFIHAGDLCRSGTLEELAIVAGWIRGLPHAHKVVVAGNHDRCLQQAPDAARRLLDGIEYLEDDGIEMAGLRLWGSPWQPEFRGWAFNLPRGEALARRWASIPPDTDVLVTHGPPRGIGDRGPDSYGPERSGCEDLLARVRAVRPALHLFGHIHQDGGAFRDGPTHLFNVTTWECERAPTVLDIDPLTRAVTPVRVPPRRGG